MDRLISLDTGLIFWTWTTFLIVLFVLATKAWKPMVAALDRRQKSIEEALAAADKAREETEKLADAIRRENEKKKKKFADKKKAEANKKVTAKRSAEKRVIGEVLTGIDQAKKLWTDGLNWEGLDNLTKTRKAWDQAERTLDRAKLRVQPLIRSKNIETLQEAIEADKEVDAGRVKIYWHLGRHYSEHLMYPEALKYINKGLATPHDAFQDRMFNELLLTVTQLRMRRRAAGKGY